MVKLIEKDKKCRYLLAKSEKKRAILKSVVSDSSLKLSVRWKASLNLSGFTKNSSKTRIVNRCILTGRPRSILRNWKVSRIAFRDLGRSGKISGLRTSSW